MKTKMKWQDWTNLVLGIWVFIAPWVLLQSDVTGAATTETVASSAMWNLWIVGAAVAILALIALFAFQVWEEWVNVGLGLWLLVSPWLLGFSSTAILTWNAVIVGVLIAVVAGLTLVPDTDEKKHSN